MLISLQANRSLCLQFFYVCLEQTKRELFLLSPSLLYPLSLLSNFRAIVVVVVAIISYSSRFDFALRRITMNLQRLRQQQQ